MARYLIVAHKTALSPELQRLVKTLVAEDPGATFGVLVPEDPGATYTWEGETVDVARQRAEAARAMLEESANAQVIRAVVGKSDPLEAIGEEMATRPGYDTLIISTLPPGVSRWLRLDLVARAERKFGLRVIHIVAEASAPPR